MLSFGIFLRPIEKIGLGRKMCIPCDSVSFSTNDLECKEQKYSFPTTNLIVLFFDTWSTSSIKVLFFCEFIWF